MKRVVITGAAQGLGKATAERLAADGYEVVGVDLAGVEHVCDVTDREAVFAVAEEIGPVDALVNNAGIWRFGPLLGMGAGDIREVLEVNVLGTVWCTQAFVPGMAERGGGAIVNLSSAAAAMHATGVGIYPVSKSAVEALTKQLAVELGPMGVRVNAIGPGLIVTEGTAKNYEGERRAQRAKSVPLGRVGDPTDIADNVAYLLSDAARYVTGQVIYVDGGVAAGRPPS